MRLISAFLLGLVISNCIWITLLLMRFYLKGRNEK